MNEHWLQAGVRVKHSRVGKATVTQCLQTFDPITRNTHYHTLIRADGDGQEYIAAGHELEQSQDDRSPSSRQA